MDDLDLRRRKQFVQAAEEEIGTPFQLYGRSPQTGLDCVGLVVCCLRCLGLNPADPAGYGLRNSSIYGWIRCAEASGLTRKRGAASQGDIVLCSLGRGQHHLMIVASDRSVIHAHAGLKKVVREPVGAGFRPDFVWQLAHNFKG